MSKAKNRNDKPGPGATQFANMGLYKSGTMPSNSNTPFRTGKGSEAERAAARRIAQVARQIGGGVVRRISDPTKKAAPVRPSRIPSSDWRVMAMRGKGMEAAAQTAANVGYTGDDVAAVIQGYTGGGGGGGGGGRGGGRGGGGGGGGGSGLPSKKDIDAAIKAMQDAATAADTEIGNIYGAADKTLAELTAQYAASQDALRQGGGRTMGAFGVQGGVLDPMMQTAGDYLTTTRGTLTGLSAAERSRLAAQKAAYALIAADILKGAK